MSGTPTRARRPNVWLAAASAIAVITVAAAAWALWPRPRPAAAPPAPRYLDVSACLLTGPSGIVPGIPAASTWTAMRAASRSTHVMVSYLPDTGSADVAPMLNALIARQCGVIIAAASDQAIRAAKANPHQSFLLLTTGAPHAAIVTSDAVIVPAAAAPDRIDQAIQALAAHAPPVQS